MNQTQTSPTLVATNAEHPRIYVACLAAYNSGYLHGSWIEATTPQVIMADTRAMLAASPIDGAEEWAIHDYEGFEGAYISEHASFEAVCELAGFVAEYGELGAKLYDHFGGHLDDARTAFDEYAGQYQSVAEFAEELHESNGTEIPDSLKNYIDWQRLGCDLRLGGDIFQIELGLDEIHIFWAR